jgi:hypothetical protein
MEKMQGGSMMKNGSLTVVCKECGAEADEIGSSQLRNGSGWHCYACRIRITAEAEFAPLWEGADPDPRAEVVHTGGWCLALRCEGRVLTVEDGFLVCDYGPTGWDEGGEGTVMYEGPDARAARAALLDDGAA